MTIEKFTLNIYAQFGGGCQAVPWVILLIGNVCYIPGADNRCNEYEMKYHP